MKFTIDFTAAWITVPKLAEENAILSQKFMDCRNSWSVS